MAEHPPAVRAVKYWLRNGTNIELEMPYEKIGTPFRKTSSENAELTASEKTKVNGQLSKCEPHIIAGNLEVLELAVEICNRCGIKLPAWLVPHIIDAINYAITLQLTARQRQGRLQRELHQIRWATVHHLRVTKKLTWDDIYEAAARDLSHTRARGSEETIRVSYKWMNRHPIIQSMRQNGLPGEVNDFAREQYENREAASERIRRLELHDKAGPKSRLRKVVR